jgi:polysaccharide export outer membrane protein
MLRISKPLILTGALIALSACSLPRGAAITSEIATSAQSETQHFAVEHVTRDNLTDLQKWPQTGWHGHYHWFASQRGPQNNRIQTGDLLNLTIWDSQVNSLITGEGQKRSEISKLEVSPSGEVFVPYVGDVVVRGLTPPAAREQIQSKLEAIAPSAQVQLELDAGVSHQVDLVSGVKTPGSYPLPNQNYSLLSLIAQGGGIDSDMRHPIVQLIRQGQTYRIPAQSLFDDARKNVTLRGQDKVIVVEDDRYFIALGATGNERQVFFEQEDVTALEALSLLGGLNDKRANLQGILILREYKTKDIREDRSGPQKEQTIFVLDLTSADGLFAARNFEINPGDTVLATESSVTSVQTVFGLLGSAVGISRALN